MVTQVRIYTVNGGMLDSWVKHFNERIVPTSAKYGIRVLGAEEALKKYEESPERAEYLPINKQHLAKTEFRNVEEALRAAAGSLSA